MFNAYKEKRASWSSMVVGSGMISGMVMYLWRRDWHCVVCSVMVGLRSSWRKTSSIDLSPTRLRLSIVRGRGAGGRESS